MAMTKPNKISEFYRSLKSKISPDEFKHMMIHLVFWFGTLLFTGIGAGIIYGIEENISPDEGQTANVSAIRYSQYFSFVYGIITATGAGYINPATTAGRWVTILLCLLGLPLALLAVADMGKFLLDTLVSFVSTLIRQFRRNKKRKDIVQRKTSAVTVADVASLEEDLKALEEEEEEEGEDEPGLRGGLLCLCLFLFIICTMLLGKDSDFYDSFMMVTTMSLDKQLVKNPEFTLIPTLLYITLGMILITMCLDAAADSFRQIHHLGAKLKGVAHVPIWFGGTKIKVRGILTPISKKYDIPMEDLEDLVKMAAEGKEWMPSPPPSPHPISDEDMIRIFGPAAEGISFCETDSLDEL